MQQGLLGISLWLVTILPSCTMYMLVAMAACGFAYYFLIYTDYLMDFLLLCLTRVSEFSLPVDFNSSEYFQALRPTPNREEWMLSNKHSLQ